MQNGIAQVQFGVLSPILALFTLVVLDLNQKQTDILEQIRHFQNNLSTNAILRSVGLEFANGFITFTVNYQFYKIESRIALIIYQG